MYSNVTCTLSPVPSYLRFVMNQTQFLSYHDQRNQLYAILMDQPEEDRPRGLDRLLSCAESAVPIRDKDNPTKVVGHRPFSTCGHRLCPMCGGGHGHNGGGGLRRRKAKYREALLSSSAVPDSTRAAVTVTIPNVHVNDLRQSVHNIQAAFLDMMRRAPFRAITGWFRATEVDLPPNNFDEMVQPHVHALLVAPFKSFSAIKENLLGRWQSAASRYGLQPLEVHCMKAYELGKWIGYTSKPLLQLTPDVLSNPPFVREFERQTRGIQLFGGSQFFNRLQAALNVA